MKNIIAATQLIIPQLKKKKTQLSTYRTDKQVTMYSENVISLSHKIHLIHVTIWLISKNDLQREKPNTNQYILYKFVLYEVPNLAKLIFVGKDSEEQFSPLGREVVYCLGGISGVLIMSYLLTGGWVISIYQYVFIEI